MLKINKWITLSFLIFLSISCDVSWFGEDVGDDTQTTQVEEEEEEKPAPKPVEPEEEEETPAKKLMESSVTIYVFDRNGNEISLGSGVFVRKGTVATNFHVIEDGESFKIVRNSDEKEADAEMLRFDKAHDLALLRVDESMPGKPLKIRSDYPDQGSEILVVGSPAGLKGTVSNGIVSAVRKSDPYNFDLIQITAPISPGSSGGPVVNKKGEIIGISVASLAVKNAQSLNFAVPAKYLEHLLE
jgi:S1-C subfamily serine protease